MAGSPEGSRTTAVLHVIPVGVSFLDKGDISLTTDRGPLAIRTHELRAVLMGLEAERDGLRGMTDDPILAFTAATLEAALDRLENQYDLTCDFELLRRAYAVICALNPHEELEKRLCPEGRDKDRLPAELSSLYLFYGQMVKDGDIHRFEITTPSVQDDFYLLASDTMEGAFFACALRTYLLDQDHLTPLYAFIRDVRVDILQGVQPVDIALFESQGIRALERVRDIVVQWQEESDHENVYLNLTGGYKGVIPIIAVLGLARCWYLYYAYEDSPALIDIDVEGIKYSEIDTTVGVTFAGRSEGPLRG